MLEKHMLAEIQCVLSFFIIVIIIIFWVFF